MSLVKIPFILSTAVALHITFTPPNAPAKQREQVRPTGAELVLLNIIPWFPPLFKAIYWFLSLVEVIVILGRTYLRTPIFDILPPNPNHDYALTPIFLLGWSLAVMGLTLRIASYRALGALFTFELSIRKEHKLVTSGPYAYVCHPGYMAIFMVVLGCDACQLYEGSLFREWGYLWRALVVVEVAAGGFVSLALATRMKKEDTILREMFGKQWVDWSKKVPARLLPVVY